MNWNERTRLTLCFGVSALAHAFVIFGLIVRPPSALNIGPYAIHAQLEGLQAVTLEPATSQEQAAEESPLPMREAPDQADPQPAVSEQPGGVTATAAAAPAAPGSGAAEAESSALPEVESLAALDDTWYPAKQLDVLPVAQVEVQPRYPEAAAARSVGGEVTLLLLVDELGEVQERTVVEANPPGVFDEAALAAFQDVFFQPAVKNGRRVRSRVLVTVTFDPTSIVREEEIGEPQISEPAQSQDLPASQ